MHEIHIHAFGNHCMVQQDARSNAAVITRFVTHSSHPAVITRFATDSKQQCRFPAAHSKQKVYKSVCEAKRKLWNIDENHSNFFIGRLPADIGMVTVVNYRCRFPATATSL